MQQVFLVSGMTCEGCKAKVEHLSQSLNSVTQVIVQLDKGLVNITSLVPMQAAELQAILPEKYSVTEHSVSGSEAIINEEMISSDVSKIRQLRPLFLILIYISVAAIVLNYDRGSISSGMLDFMGLFFIVFSFFKLLDLKGFTTSFRMYDPLAKSLNGYAWVYPFIETVLGVMFLMRFQINSALVITMVVLGITTVGVTRTLLNKKKIQCACLGTALKLPMTEATFIENVIMISMAVWMLLF